MKHVFKSPEETAAFGAEIAEKLSPGDVIAFYGGLGAGKTFIIKSICRALGVQEEVTSPTFTIMHLYEGLSPILHLDCYRIGHPEEADVFGLEEYFGGDHISFIEWPEKIKLPENRIEIFMDRMPNNEFWRQLEVKGL